MGQGTEVMFLDSRATSIFQILRLRGFDHKATYYVM